LYIMMIDSSIHIAKKTLQQAAGLVCDIT
jgi:hypothetical protein